MKGTIFSMKGNKAPGPYFSLVGFFFFFFFFQKAWPLIVKDLIDPVQYFFRSGKLIKEVNATIITLVPKNLNPSLMGDFRSISYCNVVYKCITKILANRLLPCFIPNRSISENILLAQEILKDYHKDKGEARCTIKVDLMKAYDSLGWDFILLCLTYLGAPSKYVKWVRECITTPRFSVAVNGTLVGYFEGRRGLRQGDPLSPCLFVFAMEELTRLMEEAAMDDKYFNFHPRCSKLHLTHLC